MNHVLMSEYAGLVIAYQENCVVHMIRFNEGERRIDYPQDSLMGHHTFDVERLFIVGEPRLVRSVNDLIEGYGYHLRVDDLVFLRQFLDSHEGLVGVYFLTYQSTLIDVGLMREIRREREPYVTVPWAHVGKAFQYRILSDSIIPLEDWVKMLDETGQLYYDNLPNTKIVEY
jgi:hypothetical protein